MTTEKHRKGLKMTVPRQKNDHKYAKQQKQLQRDGKN